MKKSLSKATLKEIQSILDKGDIVEIVLNAEAQLADQEVDIEPEDDFARQACFRYFRDVLLEKSMGGKEIPESIWRAKYPREFARVMQIAGPAPEREEVAA